MDIANALTSGVIVGSAYALLAIGVALIFSTTGVLNFAHAAFAMLAAYVYSWSSASQDWNVAASAALAVCAGTAYGLLVERVVVRRLTESSAASRMVATLAVLAVTQGLVLQLFGFQPTIARRLAPDGSIFIGELGIDHQQLVVIGVTLALVLALAIFLAHTRLGLAVRASAQSASGAHLVGIDRVVVARVNWAIGSFLAAVAGVLIAPLTIISIGTFPGLLLKALAGTLVGALGGLWLAAAGGIAVGALEALATTVTDVPGARELAVLLFVTVLLLARRSWPEDLTATPSLGDSTASHRPYGAGLVLVFLVAGVACLASLRDPFWAAVGVVALVYVLATLGQVVLVGWGAQLSLMHGALVGTGAFGLTWAINRLDLPIVLAILFATVAAAGLAGIVSLASLRLSGAQLLIVTLAAAQAASEWLFQVRGTAWTLQRPTALLDDRWLFTVLLAITAVVYLAVVALRRGPWGRMLDVTARSDDLAQHFGVNSRAVRAQAWVLSGAIAGLAGAFHALYLTAVKPSDFGVLLSISLLLYLVTCGRASLLAPVLVGLLFVYGPELVRVSQTGATAIPSIVSGVAVVAMLALWPSGLADLLVRRRPPSTPEPVPAPVVRSLRRAEGGRLLKRAGATA